ncbi:MAG: elongation factor G, partial [Phycisphaerae bacterium]|nr:elongation factor G [Phycisphaerae bacterium]
PFEKALREGHLVPICFTSAKTGAGIDALMEILTKMMPNPTEANPHPFVRGEGDAAEAFECVPDPAAPVIAHVFKVTTDPFVGKLGIFRIHQGTITKDTQLFINDAKKPFRVGHLFKLQGKDTTEIDAGVPGDLCAVAKVDDISFGAALHDSADHGAVQAEPHPFPVPMSGFAIQPKSRGDEQKISKAIHALEIEDPCLVIERGEETVLRGMGDIHLRVILEKMKNRYNIEVDTKPPKIAYRETVQTKGEAQYRHKKQTGGAGQFGEVHLRVEPAEAGSGFEFANDIFGGSIPGQFIPAVEKGVRQMILEGCIAGYPMQDIKASVYDGKHHPVDSKEVAFVAASRNAFKLAVQNAKPAILEPIVDMEITVPENNMGDIAGDLSGKRGRIQGTDTIPGGMVLIKAQAPLAELGQYQNQLKSVTGGQGSFSMELSHYEAVPANVQQQLVSTYKPRPDDD